jgi:serine/threonine-protein kinase
VQAFERARELRPDRPDLYAHLAGALAANEQPRRAESTYESVVYRWPEYWVGSYHLGRFYMRRGRYEAAATAFREAVDAAPQTDRLYNNLAASFVYLGDFGDARELFTKLIDQHPNYGAYSNLGTINLLDGRYADAVRRYEQALELKGSDYRLWGNLASAHYWAGAREKARTYYQRAIEMAEKQQVAPPQQPIVWAHLGGFYAMLGHRDRALALTQKAVSQAPNRPKVAYRAALTYEHLGQRDAALRWAEKALRRGLPLSYVKHQRGLRELRADPGFQEILQGLQRAS